MILRPPRSTRTDTLFPYTTLFRSGRTSADRCAAKSGHADTPQLGDRRVSEGLIVVLPERPGAEPLWTRVANGAVVRKGAGTNWLAACGLTARPGGMTVMLVPRSEERRVGKEGVSTGRSRW